MRNRIWIGIVASIALVAALPLGALAQDNGGCSNATLNGDYAFTVSGKIFHPDGTVDTRAGVAMTHFNGAGGLTQNDYLMSSSIYMASGANDGHVPGPPDPTTGFNTGETGSYTVNSDCTGKMEIDFPVPPTATTGAVIKLRIVVSDGGRVIGTVVSSLTPPGSATPVNAIIRSEGRKLTAPMAGESLAWSSPR